jgi:hypothetical protein
LAAFRLLATLILYYAILVAVVIVGLWLFPAWREFLPIGRVQSLISDTGGSGQLLTAQGGIQAAPLMSLGPSLIWLASAVFGALLASLPVSWVYIKIRNPGDYDQSLIDTIVVLPLVVTSIVVVVQHSLALAFSLAGIAGAARFRNTLKSSGDLLFILLAIGIGLSAGIGALELAMVTSAAFNLAFLALWSTNYGEREDMKRFLSGPNGNGAPHNHEHHHGHKHKHAEASVVTETVYTTVATDPLSVGETTVTTETTTVTEVTETVEVRPEEPTPDRQ